MTKKLDPEFTEENVLLMLRYASRMTREAHEKASNLQELLAALRDYVDWVHDGTKAQQKAKAKALARKGLTVQEAAQ